MARASDWFRHVNEDVLRRPNVHLRLDDGRNYLLLTPKRYDVITADIIRPDHAGTGNLYSAEYFQLARSALKDDGVMLQWLAQRSETEYKLLMRTFLSVFPDATLWADGQLVVGSKRPLRVDRAQLERRFRDPATREALEDGSAPDSVRSLLSLYWGGPEEMSRFVGAGPTLTDDLPLAEYFLSLPKDSPPT